MTAPAEPDILQVILERHAGLSLETSPAGFLTLRGPLGDGTVTFASSSRQCITDMARLYDRFRAEQQHAPRRCRCGASYASHHWDSRSRKHGHPETGCEDYQAAEVA